MQKSDRPSPTTTFTDEKCGSVNEHLQLPARADNRCAPTGRSPASGRCLPAPGDWHGRARSSRRCAKTVSMTISNRPTPRSSRSRCVRTPARMLRNRDRRLPAKPQPPAPVASPAAGSPDASCIRASRSGRPAIPPRRHARRDQQIARTACRSRRRVQSSRQNRQRHDTSHAHVTR